MFATPMPQPSSHWSIFFPYLFRRLHCGAAKAEMPGRAKSMGERVLKAEFYKRGWWGRD